MSAKSIEISVSDAKSIVYYLDCANANCEPLDPEGRSKLSKKLAKKINATGRRLGK